MATETIVHNGFTWTNIVHPTAQDVEMLRQEYPFFHPLNLEDVQSQIERPKIDEGDKYLFVVMHFPLWDPRRSLSIPSEVDMFIGRGFLITIHDGLLKPLERLFTMCMDDEDERDQLLGSGANHALHGIIDALVDYVLPILRKVDSNIRKLEQSIFTQDTRATVREMLLIRRDIISLRRIIRQQVPIIEQLENATPQMITEDQEEYFGDVADHLRKARDIIDENYEIIEGLSETVDTLASHNINEVMRILTVISVLVLPLTLISSVYGMNIPGLPFNDDPNGFWIVVVLMLIVSVGMLAFFRGRKWL